jgi:mersacidin/lichenicidin family type 2 lantibiotic
VFKPEVKAIVSAWRDEEFFESLEAPLRERIPLHPAGALQSPPLNRKRAVATMTLLNDDCNSTMVGPHGCLRD